MNSFDVFVVVVLVVCLVRGLYRGLIREVSSIIGVIGGFYAAYTYHPLLSPWLARSIGVSYSGILSFVIVFLGVFAVIAILGTIIRYLMDIVFLGWVDRVCGACFGLVKGVLFSSVLLIAMATFLDDGLPLIKTSKLSPHVSRWSEAMIQVVPTDLRSSFILKIDRIKKTWIQ